MSKSFWKKAFGPLGTNPTDIDGEDYFEEETEEYEYVEEEKEETVYQEPVFTRERAKVIPMPDRRGEAAATMTMIIFRPTAYDQTQGVIDSLKTRKPIIVNLDEIDVAVAQRILDFLSGAVYAIGGDIRKAARNIFVVVPSNVEISTTVDSTEKMYEKAFGLSD